MDQGPDRQLIAGLIASAATRFDAGPQDLVGALDRVLAGPLRLLRRDRGRVAPSVAARDDRRHPAAVLLSRRPLRNLQLGWAAVVDPAESATDPAEAYDDTQPSCGVCTDAPAFHANRKPARPLPLVVQLDSGCGGPRLSQETAPMTANGEIDPVTFERAGAACSFAPRSGREAQAKASAIRTLERLNREGGRRSRRVRRAGIRPTRRRSRSWTGPILEEHPEVRQRMWENWCRGK